MKFTIEEQDLDKGIKEFQLNRRRCCIISQSVARHNPTQYVSTGTWSIEVGSTYFRHNRKTLAIVKLFDSQKWEEIRAMLPMEIELN